MSKDYQEDIRECKEQAETLLAKLEESKEEFADLYADRQYEDSVISAQALLQIVKEIVNIFRYQKRRPPFKPYKNFRLDQRLINLNNRLSGLAVKIKEDIEKLNIGEFVKHIDAANVQVYRVLQRADDVLVGGINKTLPEKKNIQSTLIMKEDFANWEKWAREEKREETDHFYGGDESDLDPLVEIRRILGELKKNRVK